MFDLPKNKIILQWHITDRCNYRCAHCYQSAYDGTDPGIDTLVPVLDQYRDLLSYVGSVNKCRVAGHITLTGGEPFLYENIFPLLEAISKQREWTSFGILTNGSLIDREISKRLKRLGAYFVQISIDGTSSTHEALRGKGSYRDAVNALENLVAAGVRTVVSFTAHRGNYTEFSDVVRASRALNVWRVWAERMIPCGTGSSVHPDDDYIWTNDFFDIMKHARRRTIGSLLSRTDVRIDRALQFMADGGRPYSCQAGNALVTVMPNGDLLPCRRLPIAVGNIYNRSLKDLYCESNLFAQLRDQEIVSGGCEGCFYKKICRGGLRCLSYAVTGSPFNADPGCRRAARSKNHVRNDNEVAV
jgi:radical SAM protein with 4Fe4S-binding SPASM domain